MEISIKYMAPIFEHLSWARYCAQHCIHTQSNLISFNSYKASSGKELSHFIDDEIEFHRGEVTCAHAHVYTRAHIHTHTANGGTCKNLDPGLSKLQSQTITASPRVQNSSYIKCVWIIYMQSIHKIPCACVHTKLQKIFKLHFCT